MFSVPNVYRITEGPLATTDKDRNCGVFLIPFQNSVLEVVACDSDGWENISFKPKHDLSLSVLDFLKNLFWSDESFIIQYLSSSKDGTVHLWRHKQNERGILKPPGYRFGLRDATESYVFKECTKQFMAANIAQEKVNDLAFDIICWCRRQPNIKPSHIQEKINKTILTAIRRGSPW